MTDPWTPRNLTEWVGQDRVLDPLRVTLAAALEKRNAGQPWAFSVVCVGGPGLGKSALAALVADHLSIQHWRLQGNQLRSPEAAEEWLRRFAHDFDRTGRQWMFVVDEADTMPPGCVETFYETISTALFHDEGRTTPLPLCCWFTANHLSGLPEPLLSRCALYEFSYYTDDEIEEILMWSAERASYSMTTEACALLASYSWGEPRRANTLLQHVTDSVLVNRGTRIRTDDVRETFARLRLQDGGLTESQVGVLRALSGAKHRRMGIRTLSGHLGMSEKDVVLRIEPQLLRRGVVEVVPGGRQLSLEGVRVVRKLDGGDR